MSQYLAWEREYQKPKLLTKENKPQSSILDALKFLKKLGFEPSGKHILDIGSGAGRNTNYLASLGNTAVGLEISDTAVATAKEYAKADGVEVTYIKHDIGKAFPLESETFDLALDITTSNSLSESERDTYLAETFRVLKSGGYFIVRALCKDGDQNAKQLLKLSPGKEADTYIIKELGLTERVFTEKDFVSLYTKHFKLISLTKKSSYARMNNRVYKRNYLVAIFQKP